MCKKNRIVVLLGAGFPLSWGAPSSQVLYDLVAAEIRNTSFSYLVDLFPDSFEDLIAALYSYSTHRLNQFKQVLYQIKIPTGTNLDEVDKVYLNCINLVMKAVHEYETACVRKENKEHNEQLQRLFLYLRKRYRHVSVYTTNYDEILPRILNWPDKSLSLSGDTFNYSLLSQHRLGFSYSNLHGSIHLEMSHFDGQQYEITHNSFFKPLMLSHDVYGGNPREIDLFTPIVMGHSKTQQLLSKHFSFVLNCFANDLSVCDTFLAIGSSFSDSHLNAIIRQYTRARNVDYRIVSKVAIAHNSQLDNNISAYIIGYGPQYTPDTSTDPLFIREKGRVVYYKKGVDVFLEDNCFWKDYL